MSRRCQRRLTRPEPFGYHRNDIGHDLSSIVNETVKETSMNEKQQTLALIKPDALKNSLTGYVLSQLSEYHSGLCFAGTKVVSVSKMLAREHYAEHRGKVFYPALLDYIMGNLHYPDEPLRRRVIAIVYQGENAVDRLREVAGPTNPHDARHEKPGSIRSLGTLVPLVGEDGEELGHRMDNLIHGSATPEEAEREIKLWFKPCDIPPNMRIYSTKQSDLHFYYKDGNLLAEYEPGSDGMILPGNDVWETDLDTLDLIRRGKQAPCSLETVASKYLI